MNLNEFLLTHSPDDEYVTRKEMAQVVLSIVQHYEKRISSLELAYTQILQQ